MNTDEVEDSTTATKQDPPTVRTWALKIGFWDIAALVSLAAAIAQLVDFAATKKGSSLGASVVMVGAGIAVGIAVYFWRVRELQAPGGRRTRRDLILALSSAFAALAFTALAVILVFRAVAEGASLASPPPPGPTSSSAVANSSVPPSNSPTSSASTSSPPEIPATTTTTPAQPPKPTTPPPSPPATAAKAVFFEPSPSNPPTITHGTNVRVSGSVSGLNGHTLWILTRPDAGEGFYMIQNAAHMYEDGSWSFEDKEVGDASDVNSNIRYIAFQADENCARVLSGVDTFTKSMPDGCKDIGSTSVRVR
ncbi:hypothetical protein FKR81_37750 [Lentzea tibetensis]|uniref:Uncharacterized protein n=1 Tax=Lentzea tibetensis TaxID=2591470 RepID=A0A563EIX1_9PSEU|nr:hypothetical protein [Lentzea tibetensis]TWP45969.1 hypothetical protein FKR81_37750 [Lentzea tibetensis]